jgi:hypothetical protein
MGVYYHYYAFKSNRAKRLFRILEQPDNEDPWATIGQQVEAELSFDKPFGIITEELYNRKEPEWRSARLAVLGSPKRGEGQEHGCLTSKEVREAARGIAAAPTEHLERVVRATVEGWYEGPGKPSQRDEQVNQTMGEWKALVDFYQKAAANRQSVILTAG